MEREYYYIKEIEKKFISYKDRKESNISDDEYDIFCGELKYLPKTIIKRVLDEIHFVLMSAQPGKGTKGCYVNLRKMKKKGIVVLEPYIFGAFLSDESGNKKKYCERKEGKIILHEIAHHILNHSYEDEERIDFEEIEAWNQVEKWENEYTKWKRFEVFGSKNQ